MHCASLLPSEVLQSDVAVADGQRTSAGYYESNMWYSLSEEVMLISESELILLGHSRAHNLMFAEELIDCDAERKDVRREAIRPIVAYLLRRTWIKSQGL
ncbi:hypothetical protein U1Q18_044832 [Sarracenia purpurea var. burkii]